MQIMQIRSLVCVSPKRTCLAVGRLTQQHNNAGGRERPQRCWATRTTGVQMFPSPCRKTSPLREIYASGGGLLVASKRATLTELTVINRHVTSVPVYLISARKF